MESILFISFTVPFENEGGHGKDIEKDGRSGR